MEAPCPLQLLQAAPVRRKLVILLLVRFSSFPKLEFFTPAEFFMLQKEKPLSVHGNS